MKSDKQRILSLIDLAIEHKLPPPQIRYSDDQPRDDHGRWSSGGGDFVKSDKTTEQEYKHNGKWDSDRGTLHKEIINKALVGKVPVSGRKPIATILGGGTASGKTSASRKIIGDDPNTLRIDPDEIKLSIPEYAQLKQEDPSQAAARVHDESSEITKDLVSSAINKKLDFTYDSTTSGNGGVAIAQKLTAAGYDTRVLFVDVPIGMARERAQERAETSDDPMNRGRVVPDHIITGSHVGAADKFLQIAKLPGLTSTKLYDNSQPRG